MRKIISLIIIHIFIFVNSASAYPALEGVSKDKSYLRPTDARLNRATKIKKELDGDSGNLENTAEIAEDKTILDWSINGQLLGEILGKVVKEYDVRGFDGYGDKEKYPQQFDDELLLWMGRALGTAEFTSERHNQTVGLKPGDTFLIAGDNGPTTEWVKENLIKGLRETGVNIIDLGVCCSGELYSNISRFDAQGGLYVTRSHVEIGTNGFKPVIGEITLYGNMLQALMKQVLSAKYRKALTPGTIDESPIIRQRARGMYIESLRKEFADLKSAIDKIPMKIAVNFGGGSAVSYADVFGELLGEHLVKTFRAKDDPYCEEGGLPDPSRADQVALSNEKCDIIKYSSENPDVVVINFDLDADRISVVWGGKLFLGDEEFYPVIEYQLTLDKYKELNKAIYYDSRMKTEMRDLIEYFGGIAKLHPKGHSKVKATMDLLLRGLAEDEGVSLEEFLAQHPGYVNAQSEYSLHMFLTNERGEPFDDAVRFAFFWLKVFSAVREKYRQPDWSLDDYVQYLKDQGIVKESIQLKEQRTSMPEEAKKEVMLQMERNMLEFFGASDAFELIENWEQFKSRKAPFTLVEIEGVFHLMCPLGDAFWGWSNTSPKDAFGIQGTTKEGLKKLSEIMVALWVHSRNQVAQKLGMDLPSIEDTETKGLRELFGYEFGVVSAAGKIEADCLEKYPDLNTTLKALAATQEQIEERYALNEHIPIPEHIILDLDGVVLNTIPIVRENVAWLYWKITNGISDDSEIEPTDSELEEGKKIFDEQILGRPVIEKIPLMVEIAREKGVVPEGGFKLPEQYYEEYIGRRNPQIDRILETDPESLLMPGVRKFIEEMNKMGIKLYIASAAPSVTRMKMLKALNLESKFASITIVSNLEEKIEAIFRIIQESGGNLGEFAFVDDLPEAVAAVREKVGEDLTVIGMPATSGDREKMKRRQQVSFFVPDLGRLAELYIEQEKQERYALNKYNLLGVEQEVNEAIGRISQEGMLEALSLMSGKEKGDLEGLKAERPELATAIDRLAKISFDKEDARLGWVTTVKWILEHPEKLAEITGLIEEIKKAEAKNIIFCGMGGSVLCVDTIRGTFREVEGFPVMQTLSDTDPDGVRAVIDFARKNDPELKDTYVIVTSKSGTTAETLSHLEVWENALAQYSVKLEERVIVMTDPGSPTYESSFWQKRADNLREAYEGSGVTPYKNNPRILTIQLDEGTDIGGRFTAPGTRLFLLAAGLRGLDLQNLLQGAVELSEIAEAKDNPYVELGVYLYTLAQKNIKQVTLILPEEFKEIAPWAEQLFEESLGKDGKGLHIIYGERQDLTAYRKPGEDNDRVFLRFKIAGTKDENENFVNQLREKEYPLIEQETKDISDITRIMYGLEQTVATIAYLWDICFVDQPDVVLYKQKTRGYEALNREEIIGNLRARKDKKVFQGTGITVYYGHLLDKGIVKRETLEDELNKLGISLKDASAEEVTAAIVQVVMAQEDIECIDTRYYGDDRKVRPVLENWRDRVMSIFRRATKVSKGPDINHSGEQNAVAGIKGLRLINVPVPENSRKLSFGEFSYDDKLLIASALGTVDSQADGGRPALLITIPNTGKDNVASLDRFYKAVEKRIELARLAEISAADKFKEFLETRPEEFDFSEVLKQFGLTWEEAVDVLRKVKYEFGEYIEITDKRGNPSGKLKQRTAIHQDGDWHRTVHILVVNQEGQLIRQTRGAKARTSQGRKDIAAAGHVAIGGYEETALEELKEELGIGPKDIIGDLVRVGEEGQFRKEGNPSVRKDRHKSQDQYEYETGDNNREVSTLYLCVTSKTAEEINEWLRQQPQPRAVENVDYVDIKQETEKFKQNPENYASTFKQYFGYPEIVRQIVELLPPIQIIVNSRLDLFEFKPLLTHPAIMTACRNFTNPESFNNFLSFIVESPTTKEIFEKAYKNVFNVYKVTSEYDRWQKELAQVLPEEFKDTIGNLQSAISQAIKKLADENFNVKCYILSTGQEKSYKEGHPFYVNEGEFKVGQKGSVLIAPGISSCAVVSIWDKDKKIGLIAHIPIPYDGRFAEYAEWGLENILRVATDEWGIDSRNLEVGIFGERRENLEVARKFFEGRNINVPEGNVICRSGVTIKFDTENGNIYVNNEQIQKPSITPIEEKTGEIQKWVARKSFDSQEGDILSKALIERLEQLGFKISQIQEIMEDYPIASVVILPSEKIGLKFQTTSRSCCYVFLFADGAKDEGDWEDWLNKYGVIPHHWFPTEAEEVLKNIAKAGGETFPDQVSDPPSAATTLYTKGNLSLTNIEVRRTGLSSGHPTVEARFILESKDGQETVITGEAASGASAGKREAIFLFDKDFTKQAEDQPDMLTDEMIEDIYGKDVDREEALRRLKTNYEGKGVEIALWIARNILIPELTKAIKEGRVDPSERYSIDRFIREYEKTHGGDERQKLKLTGGNTTAFSTAAAKLGAKLNGIETYEFLSYRKEPNSLEIDPGQYELVIPMPVMIEGGEHGGWNTDWQEYLCEIRGDSLDEMITKSANITFELEKILKTKGEKIGVGLEAGYLPTVQSNAGPIEMIVRAGINAGYTPGKDFTIGLDVASSEFYKEYNGRYYYWYRLEGRYNRKVILSDGRVLGKFKYIREEGRNKKTRFLLLTPQEQLEWAIDVIKNPENYISSAEDFFDQNDLWGNNMLTKALQNKEFLSSLPHEFQRKEGISNVGDDISTSNIEVTKAGIDGGTVTLGRGEEAEELTLTEDTIDDVLLKLNQAGTVMEVMELVEYLRKRGRTIVHSHRGKEPSKETIRADVALASTTYPSQMHDRKGVKPKVKMKYVTYRKERTIVYDYLREAYEKIKREIETREIQKWAKVFPYINRKFIEPEEPWAVIVNHQLLRDNPSLALAIINAKRQLGGKVKFVLAYDKPEEVGAFYEAIREVTNDMVNLEGQFDWVVQERDQARKVVDEVKNKLSVERIEVIGSQRWVEPYRSVPGLKKCIVVVCGLGTGKEVSQGDLAVWAGLNAMVSKELNTTLTNEEKAKLFALEPATNFFVIDLKEVNEEVLKEIEVYRHN